MKKRSTAVAWALGLTAIALGACGGEKPVSHPVTAIQSRMRPRIALVEFIVKDDTRRQRVTELYLELEQLTFEWQRARLQMRSQIIGADGNHDGPRDETALDGLFERERVENAAYFERYTELQMALRENTTAAEFAKLDGIK